MYTGYSNFHQNYFLQMIREQKGFLDHPLKFGSKKSRYMLRNNLNPKVEDQTTLTANYKKISTKSENDQISINMKYLPAKVSKKLNLVHLHQLR